MKILSELISITSLWTLGLTIFTQEGMGGYSWREWADKKQSKWVKPLITCHLCMPSLHSPIAYGFAVGMGLIKTFSWSLLFMWPLVIMGASILNAIVWETITLLMKKVEYMDWQMEDDPNDETVVNDEPKKFYFKSN